MSAPHHDHDHGHGHHHDPRGASRLALRLSLVVLALFFVVELVGGLLTHSLALISDAGHLLTDVGAIVLALVAQWLATRPPSAQRSYGFKRAEILAALFNGVTLWLIAALIIFEAIRRFAEPPEVATLPMVAIASVGLVAQLAVSWILAKAQSESLNVRAAYLHALTDAVQSVGVIAAGVLMLVTGAYWLDPAISVVIAVLIFWGGGRLVMEASHVLLEGTPREVDLEVLLQAMQSYEGVERITDLHAWSLTTGDNSMSAHVVAHPRLDADGRESLRCELDAMVRHTFAIRHITLQVERECALEQDCHCAGWMAPSSGGEPDPA